MHPNPAFRSEDRALLETLIEEVGFGMVFGQVPDGPRVAHTPIVSSRDGAVQFHLSRANALARHLDGMNALIVINGPDAYVSPRWYEEPGQVPTWNYVTLELEGRVRKTHEEGLAALLDAIGRRQEARIVPMGGGGGTPWTPDSVPQDYWDRLIRGITGFEMEVLAWRPTFKLSQNKPEADRARIAEALEANGAKALAGLMRGLAA
ncbi:MAG: FMN-binding negative transcriptional regulator [Candidatus Andeanibacterium colombiense]|uniref:FMN-binding negative transcriptional regulator n=1 Tax=Candidatus Andeanibacterium colombiense TaxID=3121345 RepID=A0AAJ5X5E8_9SPHN|nr:MAG: FMN-binding negative transcriptional regulator [Sphingomonadaceae bacterium]